MRLELYLIAISILCIFATEFSNITLASNIALVAITIAMLSSLIKLHNAIVESKYLD